jgi:hypothetical protein
MNTLIEGKEEAMQFVINGRTLDTATSIKVAVSRGISPPSHNGLPHDSEVRYEDVLYRTSKGAFFVHEHRTEKFIKDGRPVVTDVAREFSAQDAVKWIIVRRAAVLDDTGLPMPSEAEGEASESHHVALLALRARIADAIARELGLNAEVPAERERIDARVEHLTAEWDMREVAAGGAGEAQATTDLEKLLKEHWEVGQLILDERDEEEAAT